MDADRQSLGSAHINAIGGAFKRWRGLRRAENASGRGDAAEYRESIKVLSA
jgi:hypothetical protein